MVKGHQFVATIYMIGLTFTKNLSSSSSELALGLSGYSPQIVSWEEVELSSESSYGKRLWFMMSNCGGIKLWVLWVTERLLPPEKKSLQLWSEIFHSFGGESHNDEKDEDEMQIQKETMLITCIFQDFILESNMYTKATKRIEK